MTYNRNLTLNNSTDDKISEEEIDLKKLLDIIIRNRVLILKFSLAGAIISGLIAINTKRVWQGELQIVVENREADSTSPRSIDIKGVQFSNKTADILKTEVGILKSQSLLMNTFEFVKNQKLLKKRSNKNLRFKAWKINSLKLELEEETSILNLAYRDTDKDLILPVLNRISSTYQEYSGRKRLRNIDLSMNYFENQVDKFKRKSIESLREAQQFAIDNDLTLLQDEENDLDIPNAINIEATRVEASNEIRFINQQLEQYKSLNPETDNIIYLSSSIASEDIAAIREKIIRIDDNLSRLRITYKDSDKSIQHLLKERKLIKKLLANKVNGILIARKIGAQAKLKAAERPKGVIIKYRQLLNEAARDQATLDELENEYMSISLEKARSEDPWELITTPTLLPKPVAPKRKLYVLLGLIAGIFLGSVAALITDRRKKVVFTSAEVKSLSELTLLSQLYIKKKQLFEESLDLLITGPLSAYEDRIALIVVGNIPDYPLIALDKSFKKLLKEQPRQIIITKDLREAMKCSHLIILNALGITTSEELIDTKEKISLQNKSILGVLLLMDAKLPRSKEDKIETLILKAKPLIEELKKEFYKIRSDYAIKNIKRKANHYLNLIKTTFKL